MKKKSFLFILRAKEMYFTINYTLSLSLSLSISMKLQKIDDRSVDLCIHPSF